MPFIMTLMMSLSLVASASDTAVEVTIKHALEAAQANTPGKVVAHEKADERVGSEGNAKDTKTLQPVYRIKILSLQGVMKTVRVHRQTGLVIE
jgi:hypothetical protein